MRGLLSLGVLLLFLFLLSVCVSSFLPLHEKSSQSYLHSSCFVIVLYGLHADSKKTTRKKERRENEEEHTRKTQLTHTQMEIHTLLWITFHAYRQKKQKKYTNQRYLDRQTGSRQTGRQIDRQKPERWIDTRSDTYIILLCLTWSTIHTTRVS